MQPERFTLAVELAEYWGLLGPGAASAVRPQIASDSELLRAHAASYLNAVKRASAGPDRWRGGFGIGPGDTPAFTGMHTAAARAAGATTLALRHVVAGDCTRAFSPAGGLHHAHRTQAAGFCVYNDLVVAIASVTAEHHRLRVAYVDLDAHHGDGVQEAFYDRQDVLTLSIHESGTYLYPGTGTVAETGTGAARGFALNLPLPPQAGDDCYEVTLRDVVGPALRTFAPDVIVAQLGADSHRNDPLTHLDTTVEGQYANARFLVALADELCAGRIVATGGGGYDSFSAAPRSWACALAALLGVEAPSDLPQEWRNRAHEASRGRVTPPPGTFDETTPAPPVEAQGQALEATRAVVAELLQTHPLLLGEV
jgi:acetoin utilization protein AcuC